MLCVNVNLTTCFVYNSTPGYLNSKQFNSSHHSYIYVVVLLFPSLCIHYHDYRLILHSYTLDTMNSYKIVFHVIAIGLQK